MTNWDGLSRQVSLYHYIHVLLKTNLSQISLFQGLKTLIFKKLYQLGHHFVSVDVVSSRVLHPDAAESYHKIKG